MVAERVGKPVRKIKFPLGPRGGPSRTSTRAMAQQSTGKLDKDADRMSEPGPEVLDEEEPEMQSPSTPITPPGRNPSALLGCVMGSPMTSPDTSE